MSMSRNEAVRTSKAMEAGLRLMTKTMLKMERSKALRQRSQIAVAEYEALYEAWRVLYQYWDSFQQQHEIGGY